LFASFVTSLVEVALSRNYKFFLHFFCFWCTVACNTSANNLRLN
jgi:hypothetical protein